MRVLFLLLAIAVFAIPISSSKAEVAHWIDPDLGVRLSFPDEWTRQSVSGGQERLTVYAPHAENYTHCSVYAQKDNRFKIYPSRYLKDIVPRELDGEFWQTHLADHSDSLQIKYLAKGAGLGQGYATHIDYTYIEQGGVPMRGIAFGTIYYDIRAVVQCAVEERVFAAWYPQFTDIIKTFGFSQRFHPRKWGEYRDFIRDYELNVLIPQGTNLGVGVF